MSNQTLLQQCCSEFFESGKADEPSFFRTSRFRFWGANPQQAPDFLLALSSGIHMGGHSSLYEGLESRSAVCKQAPYLLYHFYTPYVHIFVKCSYALDINIPPNDHLMKKALARLLIGWIGDV